MNYIPISDMIAGPMTKEIPAEQFIKHVDLMGLMNISMKNRDEIHFHE